MTYIRSVESHKMWQYQTKEYWLCLTDSK